MSSMQRLEGIVLWGFPTVLEIGKLASCSALSGTRSDTGGLAVIKFLKISPYGASFTHNQGCFEGRSCFMVDFKCRLVAVL